MSNISSYLLISLAIIATVEAQLKPTDGAARLIKVPLIRGTTKNAGTQGQPVINYYTQVNIGTPAKSFNIHFDVGLTDLWVPHYTWNPFKINLHYDKGFQCKVSSSCTKVDKSYSIEYQNCKLTGKPYEDIVALPSAYGVKQSGAGNHSTELVYLRQNFLAISDASDARFKALPIDGYFGLSPQGQSAASIDNFLVSLHKAGRIDNLQFAFWFNPVLDSKQGGELTLGGVDTNRYQGQIYWHQLFSINNQWSMDLQIVAFGNQVISCHQEKCQALVSSAVNEVYGPRNDVQKIYHLIGTTKDSSTGLEMVDCRRLPGLPILTFRIDGTPYTLLPSNYVRKTQDGYIFKTESCYVAILPNDDNKRQWLLGTNFLGAYYSIFDITYRQIGFASLR